MKLLRNFLSLAGAETIGKVLIFASFAWLARVAGPRGFGQLEFAGAVLFCAGLLVEQGFGSYGAREIAKDPRRTPALVSEIVLTRALLAVAAYLGMVLLTAWIDEPAVVRLVLIYGASLLGMPLLLQWVFQGHDRMRVVAMAQVIRQAVFAAIVFAGVREARELWIAAAAEVAGVASAAAFTTWQYRREFGGIGWGPAVISGQLLREGVPIGLSQIFWVARMFGGTLILGFIARSEEVGYYAGALRILLAAHTFVWLYYFNLLPSLARSWNEGQAAFVALINRSMRLVTWAGVGGGLLWAALAGPAVTIAYGQSFAPAGQALRIFAAVCVVALLSGHYRFGLIAAGRQTVEMWVTAIGAVVAAVTIPGGYLRGGVSGAAAGLLIAELVVWGGAWWGFHRGRRNFTGLTGF